MLSHRFPPLLTSEVASKILRGERWVTVNLGISRVEVTIDKESVALPGDQVVSKVDLEKIEKQGNAVFFVEHGSVYKVALRGRVFVKLVPTNGAPTIEIDGVRMHRTKKTTPDTDAREKMDILGLRGGVVLDTCMGLGYTASEALRRNADTVVTIEIHPEVAKVTLKNPWSNLIFESNVHKLIGNSFYIVGSFPPRLFDWVIHDPPRVSHAGHLYSEEFYRRLARVIINGGGIFHYTGEPGSKSRGVDLQRGVIRRLKSSGFTMLKYHPSVMGVTGVRCG